MSDHYASVKEALTSRWRIVEPGEMLMGFEEEDKAIATVNGKEVIGCSEWMRAERAVFEHIIKLHNDSLAELKRLQLLEKWLEWCLRPELSPEWNYGEANVDAMRSLLRGKIVDLPPSEDAK